MSEKKNPTIHRQNRRAFWHDYRSPGCYMITLSAALSSAPFGELMDFNHPQKAYMALSPLGRLIDTHITEISHHYPNIEILNHVVMPDHCHILLEVKSPSCVHLGAVIRGFISGVTSATTDKKAVFKIGYNDRIIQTPERLHLLRNYILANPYRLAIRKLYPDLYRRHNSISINGHRMQAYGNVFLLKDFDIQMVICSSKHTPEEKQNLKAKWRKCIDNGGVLVSGFISREEKEIRDMAIKDGGRIIRIEPFGFPEKFKPSGTEFDLCSEGRLLILSPWDYSPEKQKLTRARSLSMNLIASEIAKNNAKTVLHKS